MKKTPKHIFLPTSLVLLFLLQPLLAEGPVNISDIAGCKGIAAKAERLLCYDTVAEGGIFNEQKLQQVQEENFGKTDAPTEISADEVSVTIVRVSKSSAGTHYFYTDDGKAWKQSNAGNWTVSAPFDATVKKGLMGSFFLVTEGGKSERVKRVK
jgi:hypothetical protein